jgi:hypothetical protein
VGVAALGSVDILVRSGPEIAPFFSILLLDPLVGWQKAWFLLRNGINAPLPAFMGG